MTLSLTTTRKIPGAPDDGDPDVLTVAGGTSGQLTIPGSSLTANHNHLIIAHGTLAADASLGLASIYFRPQSSTSFATTFFSPSTINPRAKQIFGMWSGMLGVVPADAELIMSNIGLGSEYGYLYYPTLWALDLDTDTGLPYLTNGIDYKYITTTDVIDNIPASWTETGAIGFNADGVSDYLVISTLYLKDTSAVGGQVRMKAELDGTDHIGQHWETIASQSYHIYHTLNVMGILPAAGIYEGMTEYMPPLTAGAHTVRVSAQGAGVFDHVRTAHFILRLSAFEACEWDFASNFGITGCTNPLGTYDITEPTHGCPMISGIESPSVPQWGGDTSAKDRITLFRHELQSGPTPGYYPGYSYALRDYKSDSGAITNRSPTDTDRYLGAEGGSEVQAITGSFVDEDVTPSPQNLTPSLRIYAHPPNGVSWSPGNPGRTYWVSFYPTLAPIESAMFSDLNVAIAETQSVTTDTKVAIAEGYEVSADARVAIAEARSRISSLKVAIAQVLEITTDLDVLKADPHQLALSMNIHVSGSEYIEVLMRVLIALSETLTVTTKVLIAATTELTTDMNMQVSDSAQIVIEPDRPRYEALIEIDDLETA